MRSKTTAGKESKNKRSKRMLIKRLRTKRVYVPGLGYITMSHIPGSKIASVLGQGLKPHGAGMRVFGEKGGGLRPHGGGMVQGGNIFDDLVKVVTSKPSRQAIRAIRGVATPLLRSAAPFLVTQGLNAATSGPFAGLKPFIPIAAPIATQGAVAGINALDNLAATKGFGIASNAAARVNRDLKKKVKRAKTAKLDAEAARLLDSLLL